MAGAGGLRGVWAWYQAKLVQNPVRTQMITSGILWGTGDVVAQSISRSLERRAAVKDQFDGNRPVETAVCAFSITCLIRPSLQVTKICASYQVFM